MQQPQSLQSLQNEEEYEAALKQVRSYFESEPAPETLEAAHFDALAISIENYELKHYPVAATNAPVP
ncbi:hypothetical protein [Neorhizobium sp. JUb45]|uniref:hypothetical protein n=1 Tax=unclassified Neorhizobium TaxID=2629175 RepID=UPI0010495ACA|nr:hypothetical protein [Neorhizobium sp. JUb45]TCR00002.1 hypothetical protein EDF70_10779 [Neorhizobium sp. JUb45]